MLSATVPSTNRKPGKATHVDLLSDEVAQPAYNGRRCLMSLPVVLLRPPSLLYLTSVGYLYRLLVPFLRLLVAYSCIFWCLLVYFGVFWVFVRTAGAVHIIDFD